MSERQPTHQDGPESRLALTQRCLWRSSAAVSRCRHARTVPLPRSSVAARARGPVVHGGPGGRPQTCPNTGCARETCTDRPRASGPTARPPLSTTSPPTWRWPSPRRGPGRTSRLLGSSVFRFPTSGPGMSRCMCCGRPVPPRCRRPGFVGHRGLEHRSTELLRGHPTTTAACTWADLASLPGLSVTDLVIAGDAFATRDPALLEQLVALGHGDGPRRGAASAAPRPS